MLSSVLRSPLAIRINMDIMRAFVPLRRVLESHGGLAEKLDELQEKYDHQFTAVFEAIRKLMAPPKTARRRISFKAG
jgi:hypothetical protein